MFSINQRVVCIKTHSQNAVIEGNIYVVKGNKYCPQCDLYMVNVGVPNMSSRSKCRCGAVSYHNGNHWIAGDLFAPIDETFADSVLEKIMEDVLEEELELV